MPGDPVPRENRIERTRARGPWLNRFRAELTGPGTEHDGIVRVIIFERIVKALILIVLAISLMITGHTGLLAQWARDLQQDFNLNAGTSLIVRALNWAVNWAIHFTRPILLGVALILYAGLEGTEGVGLYLKKRWAEYLTVIATGLFIPYELYEVIHHVTLFKVGALLLNVAVVGYLAWKKRLFIDV